MMRRLLLLPACFLASACIAIDDDYRSYLETKGLTELVPEKFQHCHGYGCKEVSNVELSDKDWREIAHLFEPSPQNAKAERRKIASAIGLLEQKTGALAGTNEDRYGTFRKLGKYQQDCVDESINTTVYLSLLKSKGLIKFHDVLSPDVRLPLINTGRWPHQTAVIKDLQDGRTYAVDSWFHDNGFPAEIVPMDEWKDGWRPPEHLRNGDSINKD